MKYYVCLFVAILGMWLLGGGVALAAQPSTRVEWAGNTVVVQAYAPNSPRYRCY